MALISEINSASTKYCKGIQEKESFPGTGSNKAGGSFMKPHVSVSSLYPYLPSQQNHFSLKISLPSEDPEVLEKHTGLPVLALLPESEGPETDAVRFKQLAYRLGLNVR